MVVESPDEEEDPEHAVAEDSMYVDDEPPEVKPKRSRKKVGKEALPVGKNGLRKKRVMKSKTSLDAKGYMGEWTLEVRLSPAADNPPLSPVTEDYSSYESVDEEEPEEEVKPKKLASKPSGSKLKRNTSSKETKAPPKELKKRASVGRGLTSKQSAGQSSLTNFFGKKP